MCMLAADVSGKMVVDGQEGRAAVGAFKAVASVSPYIPETARALNGHNALLVLVLQRHAFLCTIRNSNTR